MSAKKVDVKGDLTAERRSLVMKKRYKGQCDC